MKEPSSEETFFTAALGLPPEQRAAYLDKACGGDAALRRRIEDLLSAHAASEFLERPAVPVAVPTMHISPPLSERAGDRVGRYKLLQQIGEGGCGVVYMAEQDEPVRRRVALKVIKLGTDTKQVIARFEAERQALALMDHPNIAKVFDAGTTDSPHPASGHPLPSDGRGAGGEGLRYVSAGRPYFVMELVRGVKITQYCDHNKLPNRERLNLFMQVCRAIQHAHQKGIIHRDIKPSNILITINDGVPVPKVIDFGIAKATTGQQLTDKTLFTAFEQFIGTPAYMSPEQAVMTSLDIDTRSDIYSLGVLLYELLTGKTPFDSKELLEAGLNAMRRTIQEQEPERPSTKLSTMVEGELTITAKRHQTEPPKLISSVRGDLDWIVMKCLEKDRARRYETANGLARDLQRHLNHEPVAARPPSNVYRFQKAVRRNKVAFAAVGAVTFSLLIGLGLSTSLYLRERAAKRLQEHLREVAQANEKQAWAARLDVVRLLGKSERIVYQLLDPGSQVESADVLRVRGDFLASRGRWTEAGTNLTRALELDADNYATSHCLAALLVYTDLDAYRAHCKKSAERFGNTTDPVCAERIAKDCLILSSSGVDRAIAAKMAETSIRAGSNHPWISWFRLVKGLSEYRQGRLASAAEWAQTALSDEGDCPQRDVEAYAVLAMALHQLEKPQAASAALVKALEIAKTKLPQLDSGKLGGLWTDVIFANLLLREAKELMQIQAPAGAVQGPRPYDNTTPKGGESEVQTQAWLATESQPAVTNIQSKSQ